MSYSRDMAQVTLLLLIRSAPHFVAPTTKYVCDYSNASLYVVPRH